MAPSRQGANVAFAAPSTTGGIAPVSVSCSPASGSLFAVGTTQVTCSATDKVSRTAACTFPITVSPPAPRLTASRILAFGDSITAGEVPVPGEFFVYPRFLMPDFSYPADLTSLLNQRYTAQGASRLDAFSVSGTTQNCDVRPPLSAGTSISVINAGCLGARATDSQTAVRLSGDLATYRPDVMLLLIGANDISVTIGPSSIDTAVSALVNLMMTAQLAGARVLVGNLLPMVAGRINSTNAGLVDAFNQRLAAVVPASSLVDLHRDIAQDTTDWISYDGLHPTAAGYQELANVWLSSLQMQFEVQPLR
jgi:lysophospholipase L1-like esterase